MEKIRFIPKNNAVHDIYAKIGIPFPAGLTSKNTQSTEYLYLKNVSDDTRNVSLSHIGNNNPDIHYSFDKQEWTVFDSEISINPNEKVWFKGTNPDGFSKTKRIQTSFVIPLKFEVGGDITSIILGDNFIEETNVSLSNYCFANLFANCSLVSAELLDFSRVVSVGDNSLFQMFYTCQILVYGPNLSSITSVGNAGLEKMYYYCYNLTTAYAPTIMWDTTKTTNWLNTYSSLQGILYADSSIIDTIPTDNVSGCRSNWTKQTI